MTDGEKQRELKLWPEEKHDSEQGRIGDGETVPDITDEEIAAAIVIIKETKRGSLTTLQRRMGIDQNRAWLILDMLEQQGVVGPPNGGEPREVLIDCDTQPAEEVADEIACFCPSCEHEAVCVVGDLCAECREDAMEASPPDEE